MRARAQTKNPAWLGRGKRLGGVAIRHASTLGLSYKIAS